MWKLISDYLERRRYANTWAKYHEKIFKLPHKKWLKQRLFYDWSFRDEMRKAAELQRQGFKL